MEGLGFLDVFNLVFVLGIKIKKKKKVLLFMVVKLSFFEGKMSIELSIVKFFFLELVLFFEVMDVDCLGILVFFVEVLEFMDIVFLELGVLDVKLVESFGDFN